MNSCVTKAQILEEEKESCGRLSNPSNPSSKPNSPASKSDLLSTLQDHRTLEDAGSGRFVL